MIRQIVSGITHPIVHSVAKPRWGETGAGPGPEPRNTLVINSLVIVLRA